MSGVKIWDFPGGPVVENSPTNAGDMPSIPGLGTNILHTEGLLSLCAATVEPVIYSPQTSTTDATSCHYGSRACALQEEKPWPRETGALQLKVCPCAPLLEKAHTPQQRPRTAKNKYILKKKKKRKERKTFH